MWSLLRQRKRERKCHSFHRKLAATGNPENRIVIGGGGGTTVRRKFHTALCGLGRMRSPFHWAGWFGPFCRRFVEARAAPRSSAPGIRPGSSWTRTCLSICYDRDRRRFSSRRHTVRTAVASRLHWNAARSDQLRMQAVTTADDNRRSSHFLSRASK